MLLTKTKQSKQIGKRRFVASVSDNFLITIIQMMNLANANVFEMS